VAGGINVRAKDDTGPTLARLTVRNNLFEDVSTKWGGSGTFLQLLRGSSDVIVDHNTAFHIGNVITAEGEPHTGFVFTNNVVLHNLYGILGTGSGVGNATIARYFPRSVFRRNVIAGGDASAYPPDNFYPQIGGPQNPVDAWKEYVEYVRRQLAGKGTDGRNPGCDRAELEAQSK
jgi:hypothetical protein